MLELDWHHTMSILSFKLHQLFILMVPVIVVWFGGARGTSFPYEPDFVQKFLPIMSQFVDCMISPLIVYPLPQSLVLLVTPWHHTVVIVSFQLTLKRGGSNQSESKRQSNDS
jgi:hypothetical protein